MEEQLNDIFLFLSTHNRPDLQIATLENVLALTGSVEGIELICQHPRLLNLFILFLQNKNSIIAKQVSLILVNISANEKGAKALLDIPVCTVAAESAQELPDSNNNSVVIFVLKCIIDPDGIVADPCCMILSNLTRPTHFIQNIIDIIEKSDIKFDQIVDVFTKNKYNNNGQKLYYLGPVFSNLSQNPKFRKYILDKSKCVIQRFLPFTEYKDSLVKRGGIVGTLRNCCFETEYHSWLLSDEVDILPRLLLPLADGTEYDDAENEKLPLELQYLPDDKVREIDPDIRCMLLEAVTQLCAIRKNREYIRDKNTYVILRELHKCEKDKKVLLACENLVDVLIRTEAEIGEDNLKEVEVSKELQNKFEEMDREYLKDE